MANAACVRRSSRGDLAAPHHPHRLRDTTVSDHSHSERTFSVGVHVFKVLAALDAGPRFVELGCRHVPEHVLSAKTSESATFERAPESKSDICD